MDDEAKRAIDEEFAELERELARIQALPQQTPREQQAVLNAYERLRAEWHAKIAAHPEQPEWQQRMQRALADGLGHVLRDRKSFGLDGKMTFHLDGEQLKKHGAPVLNAFLDGLFQGATKGKPQQQPTQPTQPQTQTPRIDWAGLLGAILKPPPKKKDE
jgi:hypothetical protein